MVGMKLEITLFEICQCTLGLCISEERKLGLLSILQFIGIGQ